MRCFMGFDQISSKSSGCYNHPLTTPGESPRIASWKAGAFRESGDQSVQEAAGPFCCANGPVFLPKLGPRTTYEPLQ